jgi:CBS domain-containing protein
MKGSLLEEQAVQFGDVELKDEKAEGNDEPISQRMTKTVRSVKANQTLLSAARKMCAAHVHRLPVLDKSGHVVGIITAFDIVAALVHACKK